MAPWCLTLNSFVSQIWRSFGVSGTCWASVALLLVVKHGHNTQFEVPLLHICKLVKNKYFIHDSEKKFCYSNWNAYKTFVFNYNACMHTCLVLNSKVYESYFTFYRLNYLKFSPKFISSFLSYCLLLLLIFPCCLAVSFICFHHFGNSLSWNCDLYSGSGMRELDTYYFCFCWSVWNRSG